MVFLYDNIDVDQPLLDIVDPNVMHPCGHSLRIVKQQCIINARLNSFACRNVNAWNSLPEKYCTVFQKNPCDYVFDDNLNSKRPILLIFGTVIT